MTKYIVLLVTFWFGAAQAASNQNSQDILVKFVKGADVRNISTLRSLSANGSKVQVLTDSWVRVQTTGAKAGRMTLSSINEDPNVEYVQPNYPIHLLESYKIQDPLQLAAFQRGLGKSVTPVPPDNPEIPDAIAQQQGPDPLFKNQWGMIDIGVKAGWNISHGDSNMVVAVLDTGVDYTHEDLLPNMWRNPGETGLDSQGRRKEKNGIDDDGNGFIDDVVGWDFASNDNKPYDLTTPWQDLLKGDGNPGHGTHCAGNIAARGDNAVGISGVAPNAKIMALRFISEKGQGTTAGALQAIKYAVDNGAKVLSNSWGSEGEDPKEGAENKALRDIIQYAEDHNVLFIAAAGNGHQGVGYDNDTDAKPGYPASYAIENIVSVAALDNTDQLGGFSNWGAKTVHIGAPGVAVFSSTVGNKYSDKVLDIGGFVATWDGTSMATPHVAGAAALYWSANPNKTWKEVKNALLTSAKKIPALSRKVISEGKLDVKELMTIH
jgi:subtilisin family serine protease